MFPSWYFIVFIFFFDSVNVHSHETTDKTHDVTKKHVSRITPAAGNGSKMLSKGKREGQDFDEFEDRVQYPDINDSQGDQRSASQEEGYGSIEKDEETNDDADKGDSAENGENDLKTRALQTGDIFTPFEFLPIATKLLSKVGSRDGKGIVSSAKSPEDLSDKLFQAYFITTRRIVILTEKDLSGLDALQALSLEGEDVKLRTSGDSITEKPLRNLNLNGQLIGLDERPMRCHYKLIFKKVSPSDSVLRKGQSGGIPQFTNILKLEKKMSPNRHLIINHKSRKSNEVNNNLKTGVQNNAANKEEVEMVKNDGEQKKRIKMTRHKVSKEGKKKVKKLKSGQKLKHRLNKSGQSMTNNEHFAPADTDMSFHMARSKKLKKQRKPRQKTSKPKFTEKQKHLRNKHIDLNLPITTTQRPVCKWRYICRVPGNLDSCRLHTSCLDGENNSPMLDKKYVDTKGKKNKEQEELIRRFRRMLRITALDEEVEKIIEQHVMLVKPENMKPDYRIETLDEYFNNIIMAQHRSTLPGEHQTPTRIPHQMAGVVSDTSHEMIDLIQSREDLRQIDGGKFKMKSTPRSNIRDPQNIHVLSESTMITTPKYNKIYL